MKSMRMLCLGALILVSSMESYAQVTNVTIRARAKDAKFIGTKHAKGYGNVLVSLHNAQTGKLLAEGVTSGDSGDTKLLLQTSLNRYDRISNDSTAKFVAKLTIDRPTLVTISLAVPSNKKYAKASNKDGFVYQTNDAIVSSTQAWIIPGKHITGEGLIVEIPGLVVDIVPPSESGAVKLSDIKKGELIIKNHLALQCGCIITPNGIWNANTIEVRGTLRKDGEKIQDIAFTYDSPSIFSGIFKGINQKGKYEVQVYAFDSLNNNTGAETIFFDVVE